MPYRYELTAYSTQKSKSQQKVIQKLRTEIAQTDAFL